MSLSEDPDADYDVDFQSECNVHGFVPVSHVSGDESTHNNLSELLVLDSSSHNSCAHLCINQLNSSVPASSQPSAGDSDLVLLTSCQHCLLPFQLWRPWRGVAIAPGSCTTCSIDQSWLSSDSNRLTR